MSVIRNKSVNSRALRRHHNARLKKARANYYSGWLGNPKRVGMLLHTACNCSCWMCGNPRRYEGNSKHALTIHELSDLEVSKLEE